MQLGNISWPATLTATFELDMRQAEDSAMTGHNQDHTRATHKGINWNHILASD